MGCKGSEVRVFSPRLENQPLIILFCKWFFHLITSFYDTLYFKIIISHIGKGMITCVVVNATLRLPAAGREPARIARLTARYGPFDQLGDMIRDSIHIQFLFSNLKIV
jgi:hypothetical protein